MGNKLGFDKMAKQLLAGTVVFYGLLIATTIGFAEKPESKYPQAGVKIESRYNDLYQKWQNKVMEECRG